MVNTSSGLLITLIAVVIVSRNRLIIIFVNTEDVQRNIIPTGLTLYTVILLLAHDE